MQGQLNQRLRSSALIAPLFSPGDVPDTAVDNDEVGWVALVSVQHITHIRRVDARAEHEANVYLAVA